MLIREYFRNFDESNCAIGCCLRTHHKLFAYLSASTGGCTPGRQASRQTFPIPFPIATLANERLRQQTRFIEPIFELDFCFTFLFSLAFCFCFNLNIKFCFVLALDNPNTCIYVPVKSLAADNGSVVVSGAYSACCGSPAPDVGSVADAALPSANAAMASKM